MTTMMTMMMVTIMPATDTPIDAFPKFLALAGSDVAELLATATHECHAQWRRIRSSLIRFIG